MGGECSTNGREEYLMSDERERQWLQRRRHGYVTSSDEGEPWFNVRIVFFLFVNIFTIVVIVANELVDFFTVEVRVTLGNRTSSHFSCDVVTALSMSLNYFSCDVNSALQP
jgi:hypothetical protein